MTPTYLTRDTVFDAIASWKLGFSFGKPIHVDATVFIPILRDTNINRQYVTLPEVNEVVIQHDVQTRRVSVRNKAKENLFIEAGTELLDGEFATTSAVVFPTATAMIPTEEVRSLPLLNPEIVDSPGQVGLGVVSEKGFVLLEVFDSPQSWFARRAGYPCCGTTNDHRDYGNVFKTLRRTIETRFESRIIYRHRPDGGEPQVKITGLAGARCIGEVVELDGRVIHLALKQTA